MKNKRGKRINEVLLHATAWKFTQMQKPSIKALAAEMDISEKNLYRWVKTEAWHHALDRLHYTGDRTFHREPTRNVQRESGELIAEAKIAYDGYIAAGEPHRRAITLTAADARLPRKRVYEWAKRFGWRSTEVSNAEKTPKDSQPPHGDSAKTKTR